MKILRAAKSVLSKPPAVVLRRAYSEVLAQYHAVSGVPEGRLRDPRGWLLRETEHSSVEELWNAIARTPYPRLDAAFLGQQAECCSSGLQRILDAAQRAMRHEVTLLGAEARLGEQIAWHRDFKSGIEWPMEFNRRLNYHDFERPSDVKVPWELSRFQWWLPVAQAYLLTGEEPLASATRTLLDDWMRANPVGVGVNWACAMEIALRLVTWTWLFRAFEGSAAWADESFRVRFLSSLFVHALQIERNLEESDVNSNHFLADAAGLVFAGLFFGGGAAPRRWSEAGWGILCREGPLQVHPDGVDYEGSVAYHRLVTELLLYPALYRRSRRLEVSQPYWRRMAQMARFIAAYSKPNGTSPLVGDADDGRVLPLGGQEALDHRYLVGLVAAATEDSDLASQFSGPMDEIYWTLGPGACAKLASATKKPLRSTAFRDGGYFVMRDERNHIFIDCAPVGLAGRGGHGHNDCLSFEAYLDGVNLITDSGTCGYTASYRDRNRFRATAAHNTPRIERREINRFVAPRMLWSLRYDAKPCLLKWSADATSATFEGSHTGYQRLSPAVHLKRTIALDYSACALSVKDEFGSEGECRIEIPLQLAPGATLGSVESGKLEVLAQGRPFRFQWWPADPWILTCGSSAVSVSYGRTTPALRLCWARTAGASAFKLLVSPAYREARAQNERLRP